MKFGVFDHMDPTCPALGRRFEDRLRLVELYERAGFHAYHLAEHHATPLGMAPSPSISSPPWRSAPDGCALHRRSTRQILLKGLTQERLVHQGK